MRTKLEKICSFILCIALLVGNNAVGILGTEMVSENVVFNEIVETVTETVEDTSSEPLKVSNPRIGEDGFTTWDCVTFGNYWQNDTNNDGNADKNDAKEPIKWRVLSIDGDDMFLLADKCLDVKPYNSVKESVTWEECSVRSWLNGLNGETDAFVSNAFSYDENLAIHNASIVNEKNDIIPGDTGVTTIDKVFLLSLGEATDETYGFLSDRLAYDNARYGVPTDYAVKQGAIIGVGAFNVMANTNWWLRTLSNNNIYTALNVAYGGSVDENVLFTNDQMAIRPAIHLNSSSNLWKYAGTIKSDGSGTEPVENPDIDKISNPHFENGNTVWDCVYFGNYWQNDTNEDGVADKADDKEKIKWRVLSIEGDDVLLLSDKNLAGKKFVNQDFAGSDTWEKSTIRSWLNGYGSSENDYEVDYSGSMTDSFKNDAFSENEYNDIRHCVVETENFYDRNDVHDTLDKIFLLSFSEATNPDYGFKEYQGPNNLANIDLKRGALTTEYAKGSGVYVDSGEYAGTSGWWLRTGGYFADSASYILPNGIVIKEGNDVRLVYGVRPAIHVKLSSLLWSYAGTVEESFGDHVPIVTFHTQEGYYDTGEERVTKVEAEVGSNYKLDHLIKPECYGKTFGGWFTHPERGYKVSEEQVYLEDTDLYARYFTPGEIRFKEDMFISGTNIDMYISPEKRSEFKKLANGNIFKKALILNDIKNDKKDAVCFGLALFAMGAKRGYINVKSRYGVDTVNEISYDDLKFREDVSLLYATQKLARYVNIASEFAKKSTKNQLSYVVDCAKDSVENGPYMVTLKSPSFSHAMVIDGYEHGVYKIADDDGGEYVYAHKIKTYDTNCGEGAPYMGEADAYKMSPEKSYIYVSENYDYWTVGGSYVLDAKHKFTSNKGASRITAVTSDRGILEWSDSFKERLNGTVVSLRNTNQKQNNRITVKAGEQSTILENGDVVGETDWGVISDIHGEYDENTEHKIIIPSELDTENITIDYDFANNDSVQIYTNDNYIGVQSDGNDLVKVSADKKEVEILGNTGDFSLDILNDVLVGNDYVISGSGNGNFNARCNEGGNGLTLKPDGDFSISVSKDDKTLCENVSGASILITETDDVQVDVDGDGIYEATVVVPDQQGISVLTETEKNFSGGAARPLIKVYDNGIELIEKKDYTLSYKNNKKAYTLSESDSGFDETKAPSIIIKGKGNYKDTKTVFFKINPLSISSNDVEIADVPVMWQNGKTQQPVPKVMFNKKALKVGANKDFTVEYYSDEECKTKVTPVNAGTYYIKISGVNNFNGDTVVEYVIGDRFSQKPVSKLVVDKIADKAYSGSPITISGNELVVKEKGGNTLEHGKNYVIISCKNNVEVGTAKLRIMGVDGTFVGTKTLTFKIKGTSLKQVSMTGFVGSLMYDGTEQKQTSIKFTNALNSSEVKAIEESEYQKLSDAEKRQYGVMLRYSNNVSAGKATMQAVGINGYYGTMKKMFKVLPFDIATDLNDLFKITLPQAQREYSRAGAKIEPIVTFKGAELIKGRDYTVSYLNNKAITSTAKVQIKGKGNFKGIDTSSQFNVVVKDLGISGNGIVLNATDRIYADKAGNWKSKCSITDDGKKLVAGKDYDSNVEYIYAYIPDGGIIRDDSTNSKSAVNRNVGDAVGDKDIVPLGTVIGVKIKASTNSGCCYKGEFWGTYRIVEKVIKDINVTVAAKEYTGNAIQLNKDDVKFTLSGVTFDIDEASYKNNINKGKASVVVKGTGNYGGSKTIKFSINPKGLSK